MLTVYVKHYLAEDGVQFFKTVWFPKVLSHLRQQAGFISLTYIQDPVNADCLFITLKFENQETLDRWIVVPIHNALIDELDSYRSRAYWEAASTEHSDADPAQVDWEIIQVS